MKKLLLITFILLLMQFSVYAEEGKVHIETFPITYEDEEFLDPFILDFINNDTTTWDVKIEEGKNGEYKTQHITGIFYAKKGISEEKETFYIVNFFYTTTVYNKFNTPEESADYYQSVLFTFFNNELFDWYPFEGEKIRDNCIKYGI